MNKSTMTSFQSWTIGSDPGRAQPCPASASVEKSHISEACFNIALGAERSVVRRDSPTCRWCGSSWWGMSWDTKQVCGLQVTAKRTSKRSTHVLSYMKPTSSLCQTQEKDIGQQNEHHWHGSKDWQNPEQRHCKIKISACGLWVSQPIQTQTTIQKHLIPMIPRHSWILLTLHVVCECLWVKIAH